MHIPTGWFMYKLKFVKDRNVRSNSKDTYYIIKSAAVCGDITPRMFKKLLNEGLEQGGSFEQSWRVNIQKLLATSFESE